MCCAALCAVLRWPQEAPVNTSYWPAAQRNQRGHHLSHKLTHVGWCARGLRMAMCPALIGASGSNTRLLRLLPPANPSAQLKKCPQTCTPSMSM